MEFFFHPWYMVAGGALISSPILIHLINRMRFKRIRWAAMEFLLKSQKRNQRKLIIEQMILLLLRILLVLLAAFLVARFVYGSGITRGASHVVVVDDTLSMFDKDREGGRETIAYETAIEQIKELAKNAAEASSKQQLKVFLLSEITGKPIYDERLSDRSVEEIDKKFAQTLRKPSLMHASPYLALQKGRQVLAGEEGDGQKILHFVSDFRDRDWTTGPDADKLHEEIRGVLDSGINLNLIDVAMPARVARSKAVNHNGNISILDLKAESRVAVEDADVEFKVLLMNHGQAKEISFVQVYINGEHDLTRDMMLEDLEPGKLKEHTFTLRFNLRTRPGMAITEKDNVEEREKKRRLEREQFHIRVTTSKTKQPEGLVADNVRDLVMEVRKKVPTLVVDGNKPEAKGEGSDMFHFQSFFAASGIYEIEDRTLATLEKADLDLYPSIVFLNVGELPEAIVKKLKAYVENGGSLCYFMGEEVKADHYNNVLFKNCLFPLLINDRPFDPLMAAGMIDPEQRVKERERLRQVDRTPKILFPKPEHALVRPLVPFATLFRYMSINVYWQAQPRSRWDPDLRKTEPLIVLPNTSTVDKYRTRAVELIQAALSATIKLADKETEYKKYVKPMEEYTRRVRNNLVAGELYRLGETLEDMLTNPGVEGDAEKPNMADLWKQQEMKGLKDEIREFRETVLYGDPLFVSKQQGKGRVTAFLTTAGTLARRGVGEDAVPWNNWGAGEISIQNLYPLFLLQLQRFLVSEGQAPQRTLGEEVRFTLDANRYAPQFAWTFIGQPDLTFDNPPKVAPEMEKGPLTKEEGNQMTFALANVRKPGVYRVSLTLLGDGPEDDRQEVRAFAFNVDSVAESDLKRANRDRLEPELPPGDAKRGKLALRVPGESYETFKERQPDASESSLLYLFFILILVVEQAMAVHLSFHTRGEQALAVSAESKHSGTGSVEARVMNETTGTTPYEQLVWRRLEEPFKLFNRELPAEVWLVALAVVLAAALFYVAWMYVKDSGTVGRYWATLLGILRLGVYAILSLVFLLPARQSYIETRTESKVIGVFDVSASLHTSDALPTGLTNERLSTRMDKVMEFLFDKKIDFLTNLEKKNPVTVYRLGTRLDENYLHFAGGRFWTKDDRENPEKDDDGVIKLPEVRALPEDYWRAWLQPHLTKVSDATGLTQPEQLRLEKLSDLNAKARKDGLTRGTNLGDSILGIVNRELNNRVQGIVVFTDGRNTEGSPNAFRELEARARAVRIPIFVVAVGEDRLKVKLEFVDIRAPQQIQPEDKFRVKTELTGEGLAGEKLDNVTLEITNTKLVKKKVKGKDGKEVEQEVEESLPIELIEGENEENPSAKREKISLGDKLVLKPPTDVVLDKGTPPRAEIEWQLDAATLAAAGKVDLNDPKYRGRKWEIAETPDDAEFKYVVRVPTDKREGLRTKFHESNKVGMKVIKKPIRVLLVAAAANRDYQFVRTLLLREMDKKRLDLTIYLQLPPEETKRRTGVVQDVPPEKLLATFPDTFRKKKDLYDLSSYDVIVGFDPDWKQIPADQIRMMKDWAEKGGGLVLLGGYINTVELIRPREADEADRFKPILDLLPVVLDDRRDYVERKTDDPWALDFEGASPEMEFLKLDEELDETKFKEDWQAFFYGTGRDRTDKAQRGFYSFYPVLRAKQGSIVIARFTDPLARLKDNTMHPFMVTTPESLPRVIWIGSAETWRLREYREAYHERFWTKLMRYGAAKSKGAVIKSIRVESPTVVSSGRNMEIEAKIDGVDGQPLDRNAKPEITLKMPAGVPDSEIKQPIIMTPRPGARDGWFSARFLVRSPGEYEYTVKVPKQPGQESEDTESGKFLVKEANPELDNTRPDYDRMYRLASEADEVLLRMSEGDRNELKRRLQRPKLESGADREDKTDIREDKPRLYFDLKNAGLIPTCMVQDVQVQVSRGKHRDLWDDGFVVHEYPPPEDPSKPAKPPVKIAYVLLAVVGLLSMEWLIRKLLRLA